MKNKILGIASAILLFTANQLSLANTCAPGPCCPPADPCCYNPCCPSNWYVAASGSVAWHTNHKFNTSGLDDEGIPFTLDTSRKYKVGGGAAASVGYIFNICNCWDLRLEGEVVWRRNSLKNINSNFTSAGVTLAETVAASGHTQDIAIMANLIGDFPLFCDLGLYLGGGIGVSFNQLVLTSENGDPISPSKQNDELFAWQVMGGFSYKICPNIDFTIGYRLFATQKVETPGAHIKSKDIPLTQSLDLGLRFRF